MNRSIRLIAARQTDWRAAVGQRIAQMKLDRDRDNEAARAGWLTLRFLWEHVVSDPDGMVDTVVETRQRRLSQFGRAS